MKDTTRRLLLTMMILLGLLVVDNLLATPNGQCALTLSVNGGAAIQPRDLPNSCQWCSTPGSNPTSAVTSGGHTWNGTQGLGAACAGSPCGENSIHWVLTNANPPFLTISNQCKPEECKPKTQCDACGTTEPDGCGGTVTCEPCECVPDPEPVNLCEGKCGNVSWTDTCGKEHQKDCGICPCIPTEEGKPSCTENDCGKTLEWIDNCGTKKYVVCDPCECIPDIDCRGRCGNPSDGCGGWVNGCPPCPPPPPPPKRWPTPVCDNCLFPESVSITSYANDNLIHIEQFMFYAPQPVRLMILDMYDAADYVIYAGSSDPADTKNRILFLVRGPGIVTVPIPSAGLPIQEYSYLGFKGGYGRLTVWVDNDSFIYVKTTEAVATP